MLKDRFRVLAALPLGLILLGAYLPDLADKSINLITGLSGRGYGHSLVVQLLICALVYLLLPRLRLPLAALALGAAVHLLQDWVEPAVLLAPLLGPIPPGPRFSFIESILGFYRHGGPQVWLEALAAGYWTMIAIRLRSRRHAEESEPAVAEKAIAYAE
jgi:membrane-bound metal-dependent hydrolase YbcI (DUF457 family)